MHLSRVGNPQSVVVGRDGRGCAKTRRRDWGRLPALAAIAALASALVMPSSAVAASLAPSPISSGAATADFAGAAASADARGVADWVVGSRDNDGLPFAVVDKTNARIFLFAAGGALLGTAPVLLGLARGDDSPSGIGDRPLALITPAERITPAGRFVAGLGFNLAGQDILWVDYAAAISVHRAADPKTGLTANGRLARLASATTADNRISHGCINVSADFFERTIRPAFSGTSGIVYVLPETRPIRAEFAIPVEQPSALAAAQAAGDSGRM
jgi:hypothetical protein